ncbi:hypothetical protein D9C73_002158 [Collichthys lucidus]|uniref:Apolipoprotein M n=1 Tax=Collichthys lucidus TaxID=240159 RepID=A0A4U5U303_COLLU|nr:hypothetical protein D9C73_002158 [Collichthys lucidus]
MMGFILIAAAVLSLLSGGQSAPVTNCDDLTQIIEIQGREQLLGKWTSLAESTNVSGSGLLSTLHVGSSWVKHTAANESNTIDVFEAINIFGRCYTSRSTKTLKNNTLSVEQPMAASEVLLKTGCPDCLVISSKYTSGQSLQFLSRRNKVTAAEMEEFTKQVKCLNLPSPVIFDSDKGFCPEESTKNTTDVNTATDEDYFKLAGDILGSEDVVKGVLESIFSSLADLIEDD